MKILGVDASSKTTAVAISDDEEILYEHFSDDGLTHSVTFLPKIIEALNQSKVELEDIEVIGITNGPGSFTGLRIGLATVKALSDVNDIKIVGMSTLEAIAYNYTDFKGYICVCLDARNREVYNGIFLSENGQIKRVIEDRCIEIDKLVEETTKYENIIFAGDCENLFGDVNFGKQNNIKAKNICKYVYNNLDITGEVKLQYLKKSQAEREKEKTKC